MKITIFALIAGLCLVAVSANASAIAPPEDTDFEFIPQDFADEIGVEIDTFSLFGPLYFVCKAALRTLKGVNCTLKGVLNIKAAALTFLDDINACGGTVSKQLQSVITATKAVITTCDNIINLNEKICQASENSENQKTGWSCFWKFLKQMLTLKKQVAKVVTLGKKVPNAGVGAGVCAQTALDELTDSFMQFPVFVKACSKLTSN